jgi:pSer/pThr/pTyr-binding forkhead associated (FHA) protein
MTQALLQQAEATSQATMPVGMPVMDAPMLVGVLAPVGGEARRLERFRTVLGRRNADIVLDDHDVSRQHAVLERYGERYLVRDLGSTNGTWVNGRKVEVEMLHSGDVIQVGDSTLVFRLELT